MKFASLVNEVRLDRSPAGASRAGRPRLAETGLPAPRRQRRRHGAVRCGFEVETLEKTALDELGVMNWPNVAKRAEEFTNSAESDELLMVYVTRAVSMTREGGRYAYVGCIDADRSGGIAHGEHDSIPARSVCCSHHSQRKLTTG